MTLMRIKKRQERKGRKETGDWFYGVGVGAKWQKGEIRDRKGTGFELNSLNRKAQSRPDNL
jgi:hypothetical protein